MAKRPKVKWTHSNTSVSPATLDFGNSDAWVAKQEYDLAVKMLALVGGQQGRVRYELEALLEDLRQCNPKMRPIKPVTRMQWIEKVERCIRLLDESVQQSLELSVDVTKET